MPANLTLYVLKDGVVLRSATVGAYEFERQWAYPAFDDAAKRRNYWKPIVINLGGPVTIEDYSAPRTFIPTTFGASPRPGQWLTAKFSRIEGATADVSLFDTDMRALDVDARGGIGTTSWEASRTSSPRPERFAVNGSWRDGGAPPYASDRQFEILFSEAPTISKRYELTTRSATATTARLRYHEGYRFRHDVWAASSGVVRVEGLTDGRIKVAIANATMVPDLADDLYGSEALGTFDVAVDAVFDPKDTYNAAAK